MKNIERLKKLNEEHLKLSNQVKYYTAINTVLAIIALACLIIANNSYNGMFCGCLFIGLTVGIVTSTIGLFLRIRYISEEIQLLRLNMEKDLDF